MDYPRNLRPSDKTLEKLRIYLDRELLAHRAERSLWVDDLLRWQEDYWATPTTKKATFPFQGAANFVVPLNAIAVESIHAREITTLFALNQFVHVKSADPNQQSIVHDIEKAVDRELYKGVDIYKFCDNALLENKKLGSCVGKSGYEKIIKTAIKEQADGTEVEFDVITRQGPTLSPVQLARFLMPFTAVDPQQSPWCGEEHLDNFYNIQQLVDSGLFYDDVSDHLTAYFATSQQHSSTKYTQGVRQLQDQLPIQWPREIGWDEIWLSFDIDNPDDMDDTTILSQMEPSLTGKAKEIVVHYHWPSRTFFSIRYNWREDLSRPYEIGNYFPMEHRWAGIGIGKQNEQFQELVTTIERQRVDNATLANMRMFKAKQGSGIGPNEPFFPGRIFLLDDMEDFEAIAGGSEVFPSSYNDASQAVIYSQQRTGANEMSMGMPQAGTPSTATSDVQRVQEYSRKFDYTFKNGKRFIKKCVLNVLAEQAQFGFRDRRYFDVLGDNGPAVEKVLSMDVQDLKSELFFEIEIVGQSSNDALDRNNWTQFAGMLTQYWQEMIQLAQLTQNPQLMQAAIAAAMGAGTEAMKQVADGFDFRGVERLLMPQGLIQLVASSPTGAQNQLNGGGGQPNGSQQPGNGRGRSTNAPSNGTGAGLGRLASINR